MHRTSISCMNHSRRRWKCNETRVRVRKISFIMHPSTVSFNRRRLIFTIASAFLRAKRSDRRMHLLVCSCWTYCTRFANGWRNIWKIDWFNVNSVVSHTGTEESRLVEEVSKRFDLMLWHGESSYLDQWKRNNLSDFHSPDDDRHEQLWERYRQHVHHS